MEAGLRMQNLIEMRRFPPLQMFGPSVSSAPEGWVTRVAFIDGALVIRAVYNEDSPRGKVLHEYRRYETNGSRTAWPRGTKDTLVIARPCGGVEMHDDTARFIIIDSVCIDFREESYNADN